MKQKLFMILFGSLFSFALQAECTAIVLNGAGTYSTPEEIGTYQTPHLYCVTPTEDCVLKIQTDIVSKVQLGGRYQCDGYNEFYATGEKPSLTIQLTSGQAFYFTYTENEGSVPFTISIRTGITFGGAVCTDPVTVTQGINFIPYNKVEYETGTYITFTPQQSGRLTLQDQNLSSITLYNDCHDTQPISVYPDYSDQQKIKILVEGGKSYLIKLSNYIPLDLNFEVTPIVLGATCDAPIMAQPGANRCKKEQAVTWFGYQPSKDGYLEISLCGLDYPFDGTVELHNGCNDYNKITASVCPDQTGGFYLRSKVNSSTKYLIRVDIPFEMDADFEFNVVETDPFAGDEFETAIPVSGSSSVSIRSNAAGSHWYKYTATQTGYMDVSNCGAVDFSGSITIKDSYNGYINSTNICNADKQSVTQRFQTQSGETYYIEWVLNSGCAVFDFAVTESVIPDGDFCSQPIVLASNIFNLKAGNGDHWYQYTPQATGWLEINIKSNQWQDYSDRVVVKDNCLAIESPVRSLEPTAQGIIYRTKAVAGAPLMINLVINSNLSTDTEVELSVSSYQLGDICSMAHSKELGTHIHPKSGEPLWYSFTAPKDAFYSISTTLPSYYSSLKTKKGNCDAELQTIGSQPNSNYTYQTVVQLQSAETIYFEIDPHQASVSDFSFTIAEKTFLPGELCQTAAVVPIDGTMQQLSLEGNKPFWYTFTPSKAGKVSVSSCGTGSYSGFELFTECTGRAIAFSNSCPDYNGQQLLATVEAGTPYLIKVQSAYSGNTSFSVTLSDLEQGDHCLLPITLVEGSNNCRSTGNGLWYHYKAPFAGTLSLSNCGAKYYGSWILYDACQGNQIQVTNNCLTSDGYNIELDMSANQEVWLKMYQMEIITAVELTFTPIVGIEKESAATMLYPNPTKGLFEIAHQEPLLLSIYNLAGILVHQQPISSIGISQVDARHLESGIYMVRLIERGHQRSVKLVIE